MRLVAHLSGRSTVPPEGPFTDLLLNTGLALSVGTLALAASQGRHFGHSCAMET